jgi:hypothetical protein
MSILPIIFIQNKNILHETINEANFSYEKNDSLREFQIDTCHSSTPLPEWGFGRIDIKQIFIINGHSFYYELIFGTLDESKKLIRITSLSGKIYINIKHNIYSNVKFEFSP